MSSQSLIHVAFYEEQYSRLPKISSGWFTEKTSQCLTLEMCLHVSPCRYCTDVQCVICLRYGHCQYLWSQMNVVTEVRATCETAVRDEMLGTNSGLAIFSVELAL